MRLPLAMLLAFCAAASPLAAQTFTNASAQLPSTTMGGIGATIVDVDGDGRMDLVDPGRMLLQRDGGFDAVPITGDTNLGAIFGDLDRDGLLDALMLYAFDPSVSRYDPALETLVPIDGSGIQVGSDFFLTQGSILLDYDQDGALDVLLGNDGGIDYLYRGAGDGSFTNVSDATLPQLPRGDYGMAAADYDQDGDPDVYIGLCIGDTENLLYRNDNGIFAEAAAPSGVDDERASWGVVWLDYDNDGWLDIFVANMPGVGDGKNGLFRNLGNGTFTDVAAAAGVDGPASESAWSVAAADFDNDGWTDLFVTNRPEPSRLYRNNGDGTFSDITNAAGMGGIATIPVAAGDVTGDGWIDLFLPSTQNQNSTLFYNDGGTNGWLRLRLRGTDSNPDGIGARVEVSAGNLSLVREITAGDGFMAHSHGLEAHVGLGTASTADITVRWPSGHVDEITGVTPNQHLTLVEGVGINAAPEPFALLGPDAGASFPEGTPVTLSWEAAADADPVTYTVHVNGPSGDRTYETTQTTLTLDGRTLTPRGEYRWAVVARDAYSTRTVLDPSFFIGGPVPNEPDTPAHSALTLEVWPNPTPDGLTARYALPEASAVRLDVIDALGRTVAVQELGVQAEGSHTVRVPLEALSGGVYLVRVETESGAAITQPFVRVE